MVAEKLAGVRVIKRSADRSERARNAPRGVAVQTAHISGSSKAIHYYEWLAELPSDNVRYK